MSHGPPPQFLEPQYFFPLFIGGWLGVTALLAYLGGWVSLAKEFRTDAPAAGESFRFVSGGMGRAAFPVSYRSCLSLVVTPAGFRLAILFPFRLLSPPLFVPWTRVESLEEGRRFLVKSVQIRIRGCWPTISIANRGAREALRDAYRAAGGRVS
jgi:hypothetical protein